MKELKSKSDKWTIIEDKRIVNYSIDYGYLCDVLNINLANNLINIRTVNYKYIYTKNTIMKILSTDIVINIIINGLEVEFNPIYEILQYGLFEINIPANSSIIIKDAKNILFIEELFNDCGNPR